MPILDKYLRPISEQRADELHLYANVPPTYLFEQRPVKELKQSLNNAEILELLQEILTPDEVSELEGKRRLNYEYSTSFGSFRCQLRWSDGDLKTRFTLQKTVTPPASAARPASSAGPLQSALEAREPEPSSPLGAKPYSKTPSLAPPFGAGVPTPPPSSAALQAPQTPPPSASVGHSGLPPELEHKKFAPAEARVLQTLYQSAYQDNTEIDRLFKLLLKERGSDLHLSSEEKPIIRVDGRMRRLEHLPTLSSEQVTQLIAPTMPDRNRSEFMDGWDTDYAYEVEGVGRFRANIFMDRKGVGGVFRLIPSEVVTAEQLGLPKAITDLCYLSKGLVLVTGPTGSGKSTTLCALVDLINRMRHEHVITIEDPIEFVHENKNCLINQREVGVHTDSFKVALRAALREDPDVVLVGELRDLETMAIAIETAETGHLVFGTLHTTSAVSTVDRLIDQFPGERQSQIRMMLSNSLKAVISQTLLRRRESGRIAAMEVLLVTPGVANLVREQKLHQIPTIMQTSRALGMQRLNDVLFDFVTRGIVDVKEAYIKAIDKTDFLGMLEDAGVNVQSITSGNLNQELL